MPTPIELVLILFATFYVALAVTSTHGPWDVFLRIRQHVPLGGLTLCFICFALWCSLIFVVLLRIGLVDVLVVCAGAGGAVFVWRWTGGSNV